MQKVPADSTRVIHSPAPGPLEKPRRLPPRIHTAMKSTSIASCVVCLVMGGGAGLLLLRVSESANAADRAEASTSRTLNRESDVYADVEEIVGRLENGSVTLASIIDTAALLLSFLDGKPEATDDGGFSLPLACRGEEFGRLTFLGTRPDGKSDWEFQIMIDPPLRYRGLAEQTSFSIHCRCANGTITALGAATQTHLIKDQTTLQAIGFGPFVIGGDRKSVV